GGIGQALAPGAPSGRGAGGEGLTGPAVLEAMDLCLECKACKSECPTNVDMARLKSEVLDQHHKKHGLPWRNWLFGNVSRLTAWPLVNSFARSRLGRRLNELFFGIDRRRIPPKAGATEFDWAFAFRKEYWLPADAEESEDPWFEQWQAARGFPDDPRPRLLIFPDTFTNYYEPALGMAAADMLKAL